MMKSYMARPLEVERKWYVVDAEGKYLGRLATEIVRVLRGKNKPQYTPHVDVGDFVVVVNADRVAVTGRKAEQRVYRRHSGYPGGMKETSYEQMLARKPTEVLRKAVYGMMPKTRLARKQFKKLKIYAGPEHPHAAQDPQTLEVK
jgi:large subunit ribosomal protein L13